MKKKDTIEKHTKIANDIMYYIYKYIDTDINLDDLSIELNVSKYHMHRIFKEEFGENIYESIKSIRLQKASSLLLTNKSSTITEIANMCGYSAQGAFIRVFKQKFSMTPKQWRTGGYKEFSKHFKSNDKFKDLKPKIEKEPELDLYYIRHKGYDKSISDTWQRLQTHILCSDIEEYKQVGLHHDNPTITPLNECRYIACIYIEDKEKKLNLPTLTLPKGVYARFDFSGEYGDILEFMNWVYFEWIINSGYETTTNPSFAVYEKNHFIEDDGKFKLSYYISITTH